MIDEERRGSDHASLVEVSGHPELGETFANRLLNSGTSFSRPCSHLSKEVLRVGETLQGPNSLVGDLPMPTTVGSFEEPAGFSEILRHPPPVLSGSGPTTASRDFSFVGIEW